MESGRDDMAVIKPGQKGIVYENYLDFETSIFRKVYDKAKDLAKQIIERNRDLQKSKTHGNDFRNKEQFDNIISFIGRRGTGKTSAMLSFMEALKDHYKFHEVIDDEKEQYEFISLEWIDASLLENNEDIFETILAKMFGELLKKNDNIFGSRKSDLDYAYRDLYQQFEKIYKRVLNLKRKESDHDEEMPINVLRDLARSTEIRADFARLVKSYIKFSEDVAGAGDRYNKDTYLVIAIDDIDLNVENGYEILEKIHRYLMVPGLIVLVAINYEEMLLCCEKRYIEEHRDLPENIVENVGERAIQMSEEYLEKVLPPHMRVYLPSLKKTDYALRENRKIEIDKKKYSIKAGIFGLVWDRTRVFFDAKGKKRHFMEPVTLRNLNTNFQLYHNMDKFPDKDSKDYKENFWKIYDENYYKVVDDILFRFACDSLPNREYRLFMKWSEADILRRGQEIAEEVIAGYPEKEKASVNARNRDIDDFAIDYRGFEYGYGELLRSLYCMSRKSIYDKRLVHVLLAQYTVVFSRVFEKYQEKDPDSREKLEKLMGQSVGGSWAKYVLPRINLDNTYDKSDAYWGAYIYSSGKNVTLCCIGEGTAALQHLTDIVEKKDFSKCPDFFGSDEMESLKIWMFFFSNFTGQSGKYSLVIEKEPERTVPVTAETKNRTETSAAAGEAGEAEDIEVETGEAEAGAAETGIPAAEKPETVPTVRVNMKSTLQNAEYRIRYAGGEVRFNVFDFVNKCFNYETVIRDFYTAVFEALYQAAGEIVKSGDIGTKVDSIISTEMNAEGSLLNQFRKWSVDGGLALPVYNLDITYNLIKRLVVSCKERNVSSIESDEAFFYIQQLFRDIAKKLKEQDEFYNKEVFQKNTGSNFAGMFNECPVIKRILDKDTKQTDKYKKVLEYYASMSYRRDKEDSVNTLSKM